jgi:hypothetical protein
MSASYPQKSKRNPFSGEERTVFSFQVKATYHERELEELLETLERRGGSYVHRGDGRFALGIPIHLPWIPFYRTIMDCKAVSITDIIPAHPRQVTITVESEG